MMAGSEAARLSSWRLGILTAASARAKKRKASRGLPGPRELSGSPARRCCRRGVIDREPLALQADNDGISETCIILDDQDSAQGLLLTSLEVLCQAMARANTKTGLTTTVNVLPGEYPTGEKAPKNYKKTTGMRFDDELPAWNYRAVPAKWRS